MNMFFPQNIRNMMEFSCFSSCILWQNILSTSVKMVEYNKSNKEFISVFICECLNAYAHIQVKIKTIYISLTIGSSFGLIFQHFAGKLNTVITDTYINLLISSHSSLLISTLQNTTFIINNL